MSIDIPAVSKQIAERLYDEAIDQPDDHQHWPFFNTDKAAPIIAAVLQETVGEQDDTLAREIITDYRDTAQRYLDNNCPKSTWQPIVDKCDKWLKEAQ